MKNESLLMFDSTTRRDNNKKKKQPLDPQGVLNRRKIIQFKSDTTTKTATTIMALPSSQHSIYYNDNNKSNKIYFKKFSHHWLLALIVLIATTTQQLTSFVVCQDFQDLTKQPIGSGNNNNHDHTSTLHHHTFQPLNRQQQAVVAHSHGATGGGKHSMQRPVLSSRFAPIAGSGYGSGSGGLVAQASTNSATVFSSPLIQQASVASQQQVPISQQVAAANIAPAPAPAATSNIEQLMKNALARTAQMNAAAESRSDVVAAEQQQQSTPIVAARSTQVQQQQVSSAPINNNNNNKLAIVESTSASEIVSDSLGGASADSDNGDKGTTLNPTTSGHETVYSDQRFANLFARRGNSSKKSRLNPTEIVKAKPTLPSFIKTPPDPKQFNSIAQANNQQDTRATGLTSSASAQFASQRLQQQQQQQINQGRINLANQQKKASAAVITSNSAAQANNKRANSLNGKPINQANSQGSAIPKSGVGSRITTSKPVTQPASNNPFNRSQSSSSSDPANVIAMARKRLLANNALESAKLKQQQQQQQQQQQNKPIPS